MPLPTCHLAARDDRSQTKRWPERDIAAGPLVVDESGRAVEPPRVKLFVAPRR